MKLSLGPLSLFTAGAVVLSMACGGADPTVVQPSAERAPGKEMEGSRQPAEEPRSPADSRPDAPATAPVTEHKGPFFRASADHKGLAAFTLDDATLGPDGALRITEGKGHPGSEPASSFYSGGAFRFAVVTRQSGSRPPRSNR